MTVSNGNKSSIHYFNSHVGTGSKRHDELLHDNINALISSNVAGLNFLNFISVSVSSCLSKSSLLKLALIVSILA